MEKGGAKDYNIHLWGRRGGEGWPGEGRGGQGRGRGLYPSLGRKELEEGRGQATSEVQTNTLRTKLLKNELCDAKR